MGQAKGLVKLPQLPNAVERAVALFGKPEGLQLNNKNFLLPEPEPQSKGAV